MKKELLLHLDINSKKVILDDSKKISFFATKASKWWKFWEYQIGVKTNIGKYSHSFSIGIGERNCSFGWGNSTLDMQIGIDKIGFGTTKTKNGVTEYTQYYIRTIPTVSVVLLVILAPEIVAEIAATAGSLGAAFGF